MHDTPRRRTACLDLLARGATQSCLVLIPHDVGERGQFARMWRVRAGQPEAVARQVADPAYLTVQGSWPAVPGSLVRPVRLHREPPEHGVARFGRSRRRPRCRPAWPFVESWHRGAWQFDQRQLARFILKPAARQGIRQVHARMGMNADRVRAVLFRVRGDGRLSPRRCRQRGAQCNAQTKQQQVAVRHGDGRPGPARGGCLAGAAEPISRVGARSLSRTAPPP